MINVGLFSSVSGEWETPPGLFDALNAEFGFTLDPCATGANAKCDRYYTKADNGLAQSWANEIVFVNPPYGKVIGLWVAKCHMESQEARVVVGLLPARTDTRWWHNYVMQAAEIRLIKGRAGFYWRGDRIGPAPFPSCIVVWRPGYWTPRLSSVGPYTS